MNRTRWKALLWLAIALSTTVALVGVIVLWHTSSFEQKEERQIFWIPDGAEVRLKGDVRLAGDSATADIQEIEKKVTQEGLAESLLVMPFVKHRDTKRPAVRYKLYRPSQVDLTSLQHMASVDEPPRFQEWGVTLTEGNTIFLYTSSRQYVVVIGAILVFLAGIAGIVALVSGIILVVGHGFSTTALREIAKEGTRATSG